MNVAGFMQYMKEQFPEPLSNHFTYNLLENLVFDFLTQYGEELAPELLATIIPEIDKREISQFCTNKNK